VIAGRFAGVFALGRSRSVPTPVRASGGWVTPKVHLAFEGLSGAIGRRFVMLSPNLRAAVPDAYWHATQMP